MPRVIKIDHEVELKVTHNDCGAQIGYFWNETKTAIHEDYGGGKEIWWYIVCPHCGKNVEVTKKW